MDRRRVLKLTVSASIFALALTGCGEDITLDYSQYITVFEGRGTVQCQSAGGITPQQSGLKLIRQGLDVRRSGCGVMTNVAFPAVCGGATGEILLHDIPAVSLDVADRLQFKSVDTLNNGYAWVDCESGRILP